MTPVIVYSAKEFSLKERNKLKQYANRILLKDVNSLDLLLEETVMLLHIDHKELLPEKRKMIEDLRSKKDVLNGKNVLVVNGVRQLIYRDGICNGHIHIQNEVIANDPLFRVKTMKSAEFKLFQGDC